MGVLTKEEILFLLKKDAEDRERALAEQAAKAAEAAEAPKEMERSRILADYFALVKASFVSLGQRATRKAHEADSHVILDTTTFEMPESVDDKQEIESAIHGIDADIEGVIAAFYEGDLSEEEFNTYMMEKANELKEKWSPAMEAAKNNVKARVDAIKILDALLADMPETHTIMPFRSLLEGWRRELKTI